MIPFGTHLACWPQRFRGRLFCSRGWWVSRASSIVRFWRSCS